jgi:uncharacterized protein YbjT (DUF2867 family)
MRHVVARELLACGEPVRVMTRRPARAETLRRARAGIIRGDLLDRDTLERACERASMVLTAANTLFGREMRASIHAGVRGQRDGAALG